MLQMDPEGREISALMARLPAAASRCRVLEIGCGDGRLTRRYSGAVASVIAIDPDEARIARFRESNTDRHVDVRLAGVDRVVVPDGTVDVTLFSWSL